MLKYDLYTFNSLQKLRKLYKISFRKRKRIHKEKCWGRLLEAIETRNVKRFWKLVQVGSGKKQRTLNSAVTEDAWERYLGEIYEEEAHQERHKDTSWIEVEQDIRYFFTVYNVRQIISKLTLTRAAGPDDLPAVIMKMRPDWWAEFFTKMFNRILDSGIMPENWRRAIIRPIHKRGDIMIPKNYRLNSLLDVSEKVFAKIILEKLKEWAEDNQIVPPKQGGFRKGHSIIDHCFALWAMAQKSTEQGVVCSAAL